MGTRVIIPALRRKRIKNRLRLYSRTPPLPGLISGSGGREETMKMGIEIEPIGLVSTDAENIPRHWTMSDVEGTLIIEEQYRRGLSDIGPGQKIYVIFHFNQSPGFRPDRIRVNCSSLPKELGVFSTLSPIRPNALGLSVLDVQGVNGSVIHVKGLDMLDGTPILDIKPYLVPVPENKTS